MPNSCDSDYNHSNLAVNEELPSLPCSPKLMPQESSSFSNMSELALPLNVNETQSAPSRKIVLDELISFFAERGIVGVSLPLSEKLMNQANNILSCNNDSNMLLLHGPEGTGKKCFAKILSELLDAKPNIIKVEDVLRKRNKEDFRKYLTELLQILPNQPNADGSEQKLNTFIFEDLHKVKNVVDLNHVRLIDVLVDILGNELTQDNFAIIGTVSGPHEVILELIKSFSATIEVQLPNDKERLEILNYYLLNRGIESSNLARELNVNNIATSMSALSGARIAAVVKDISLVLKSGHQVNINTGSSILNTQATGLPRITEHDFEDSIARVSSLSLDKIIGYIQR